MNHYEISEDGIILRSGNWIKNMLMDLIGMIVIMFIIVSPFIYIVLVVAAQDNY